MTRRVRMVGIYDDIDEGQQQLTKEEFEKMLGKKEKKKMSLNPLNLFKKKRPVEEELAENEYQDIAQDQVDSERDITDSKLIEYSERQSAPPESEEELTAKLFEVDARLSHKKEITRVMDKQLGLERDIALESADKYPEIYLSDATKGNLDDSDVVSCFLHGINVIEDRMDSEAYKFPLRSLAEFDAAILHLKTHLSRGKDGFSVKYSRTHLTSATIERIKRKRELEAKKNKSIF